jgi:hypothetical protein
MGHIHIGYDDHNYATSTEIVRAMDLFLSVPLVLMEPDNERKKMYGKAGSYRNQPWGVEYRSTSNYIFSSVELMKWAYNQTLLAIKFLNDDNSNKLYSEKSDIIDAINDKNKVVAKQLIEKYNLIVIGEPVAKLV